jgi:hypothetical protein
MPELHIRKLANAFNRNAQPSLGGAAGAAVQRYQRKNGGVWVGGAVEITSTEIAFTSNRINAALHAKATSKRIPMSQVVAVRREFGWLTGIVVVTHARGEFRFRCFGANGVAKRINAYLAQLGVTSPLRENRRSEA